MLRPGKGKVSDAAVETLQTAKPAVDGTADGDVAQKVCAHCERMFSLQCATAMYICHLQDSCRNCCG
jgi:hypothetical protein